MGRSVNAVVYDVNTIFPSAKSAFVDQTFLQNLGIRFLWSIDDELLPTLNATEIPDDDLGEVFPMEYGVASSELPLSNWGTKLLRIDVAEDVTGAGVLVAVVDSGVSGQHPLIIESIVHQRIVVGERATIAVYDKSLPIDSGWHGTHVASIIAGPNGVAQNAKILSVQVLQGTAGSVQSICAGIDYVLGRTDVSVVCLSFELGKNDLMAYAISRLVGSGKIIVAAAGNHGVGSTPLPAACLGVVSVGAFTEDGSVLQNSAGGLMDWDGALHRVPTVIAPGHLIVGADADGLGRKVASGTSQAAPGVAGLAALMLQVKPSMSSTEFLSRLIASAIDIPPDGWDNRGGYGSARYS